MDAFGYAVMAAAMLVPFTCMALVGALAYGLYRLAWCACRYLWCACGRYRHGG